MCWIGHDDFLHHFLLVHVTQLSSSTMEQTATWELMVVQTVNEFLILYGIQRFVILFTRTHIWSLSWCLLCSFCKINFNIIFWSMPWSCQWSFLDSQPQHYAFLFSPIRATCCAHLPPSPFMWSPNNIFWGYKSYSCSVCSLL